MRLMATNDRVESLHDVGEVILRRAGVVGQAQPGTDVGDTITDECRNRGQRAIDVDLAVAAADRCEVADDLNI